MDTFTFQIAKWIWTASKDCGTDIYRCFRKTFAVSSTQLSLPLFLHIAADTSFSAWINGIRCQITQYQDVPPRYPVSLLDITGLLHEGENSLCILVYHQGTPSFTSVATDTPGVVAWISADKQTVCATDGSWKCAVEPAYTSGLNIPLTEQLGMTFEYDARRENNWQASAFNDSNWANAIEILSEERIMPERPVPNLQEGIAPDVSIIQAGSFLRIPDKSRSFAQTVSRDYLRAYPLQECFPATRESAGSSSIAVTLPADGSCPLTLSPCQENENGRYLIADLGKEYAGYLHVRVRASAGTVIDIAHGEHLVDGRIRATILRRNFADRLYCKDGLTECLHSFRRLGARYIELHFSNSTGEIQLVSLSVIPVELPLPPSAFFSTDDTLFMKIHSVAERTLLLCMHDHYEDCPWREQALYGYDSRNQILCGNYRWNNWKFVAASLELLGRSYRGDGYLAIIAPSNSRHELTIPSFTMAWIVELWEYFLYSGDGSIFVRFSATVDDILDKALARLDDRTGLYLNAPGEDIWKFCEWTDDLSYQDSSLNASDTLYLREALLAASSMHKYNGNATRAEFLYDKAIEAGRRVEQLFWNDDLGGYQTSLANCKRLSAHIQYMMLYHELVPGGRLPRVMASLERHQTVPASFGTYPYTINGMMKGEPAAREKLDEKMTSDFAPMLLSNATSFWETAAGSEDFCQAGSCCHGWSGIACYYAGAFILGVTPQTPGYRQFRLSPYPGKRQYASGDVPTPYGNIHVEWRREKDGVSVFFTHPEECTPCIMQYEEFPLHIVTVPIG